MLRFLLIVFGIYLFFRIMARWVAPLLLKRYVKRMQKRYEEQNGYMHTKDRDTRIHIPRKDRSRQGKSTNDVEDIPYEEIK